MDDADQPVIRTTVLIVSYNCVQALRQCLASLERSDERESIEVLVVDAGSTDESGSVDGEFEAVNVLRLPRNFGLTRARNIGARTAKGKYLLLLAPDTEVLPDTIARLAAHLDAEAGAVAVCPLLVDTAGKPASQAGVLATPNELSAIWRSGEPWSRPLVPPPAVSGEDPIEVDFPDPRAVLIRTQAIRGMNYIDERYGEFGSSLEVPAQAARAGKRILLLPGVRAVTRNGEGLWRPTTAAARDDLLADFAHGIITYAGKHYGFLKGFRIRLGMLLGTLFTARLGLFGRLLGGHKIDGSQQGL